MGAVMNMRLGRQALSKAELERKVLSYLRMLPGSQHVARVMVAGRSHSARNWVVVEIDPPLSTAADDEARNALATLQASFDWRSDRRQFSILRKGRVSRTCPSSSASSTRPLPAPRPVRSRAAVKSPTLARNSACAAWRERVIPSSSGTAKPSSRMWK